MMNKPIGRAQRLPERPSAAGFLAGTWVAIHLYTSEKPVHYDRFQGYESETAITNAIRQRYADRRVADPLLELLDLRGMPVTVEGHTAAAARVYERLQFWFALVA